MRSLLFSSLLVTGAFLPVVVLTERWGWFKCPRTAPADITVDRNNPLDPMMMPLKVYLMDGPPEEAGQFNNIAIDFDNSTWVVNYFNSTSEATPILSPAVLQPNGSLPKTVILKGLPRYLLGANKNGYVVLSPIHVIPNKVVIFWACRRAFLVHKIYRYLAVANSVNTTALDWRCMAGVFDDKYSIDSIPGGVLPSGG